MNKHLKAGLIFATIWLVVLIGANQVQKQFDKFTCSKFQELTNRETKFVSYYVFKWDCLAKTGEAYLPIDRLREID